MILFPGDFCAFITDSREMTGNMGERNVTKEPELEPWTLRLVITILTPKLPGLPITFISHFVSFPFYHVPFQIGVGDLAQKK